MFNINGSFPLGTPANTFTSCSSHLSEVPDTSTRSTSGTYLCPDKKLSLYFDTDYPVFVVPFKGKVSVKEKNKV